MSRRHRGRSSKVEREREPMNPGIKFCKRLFSVRQDDFGSKRVIFAWQQSAGTLLASAIEGNPIVHIYNRLGQVEGQIPLHGSCVALSWDADGDFLAVVTEGSSQIVLWEAHTRKMTEIDSSLKDTGSSLAWSKVGKVFAYGTVRGNLLIYNHRTMRKVPIIGKHSKKIVCCSWSNDNILALGTADNVLSLNTSDGDSIKTTQLRGKPQDLKFGNLKEDQSTNNLQNTVSLIVGEKTLFLLRLENGAHGTPLELGFQARYGNLVGHSWLGDGYILASFSAGFLVTISTHHKEIGTEIILVELNEDPLRWTSLCVKTGQICVCYGDTKVEIRDALDPNQSKCSAELEDEIGRISAPIQSDFNEDGQLLAVATGAGDLHIYLTSVPLLGGSSPDYLIQLSSLTEATLHAFTPTAAAKCQTLALDIEPTLIMMGPSHIGAVLNNRVWFYNTQDCLQGPPMDKPFCIKEYNSNITSGAMNSEYVSLLAGDRLCVHLIDNDTQEVDRGMKFFQEMQGKKENRISCLALSKDILFFGTDQGYLRLFDLERWEEMNSNLIRGKAKLRSIYPDSTGTRIVVTAKDGAGYFFDMRTDGVEEITNFPSRIDGLHWDQYNRTTHIFLTYSLGSSSVDIFSTWRDVKGEIEVAHVKNIKIFPTLDNQPLCLRNGVIYSQTSTGKLTRTIEMYTERPEFQSPEGKWEKLLWLLELKKFRDAYRFCKTEKLAKQFWLKLGSAAAASLALPYAKKAFSNAGSYGSAYNMAEIVYQDDLRLQHGHVCATFQRYDEAEASFLKSSERHAALRMRYDLRQWEEAYHLATELAPDECAEIALRFAEHDELARNYSRALESYTNAAAYAESYNHLKQFEEAKLGIGRNCLRCGQIQRGMEIIAQPNVPSAIKLECAEILESTKFLTEAAKLYDESGKAEKAAALFIRTKNWDRLDKILPDVTSKKILLQYAKSREVEGNFKAAADSYKNGGDVVNAVRLYLKCDEMDAAINLVKETPNRDAGIVIANHFVAYNDFETAIRFLLICRLFQEAVELTFQHGLFDTFAQLSQSYCDKEIPDARIPAQIAEGFIRMAEFYEGLKDHYKAAKFCYLGGELEKGFKILIRAGGGGMIQNEEEFLTLLINIGVELTEDGENTAIASELVAFLLGDKDGNPKDAKYLLQFYAMSKREIEAVKTCLIYASDELKTGSYKNAHQAFVNTILQLRTDKNRSIPSMLYNAFKLVHFYYLAKLQAAAERDYEAARLLQFVYPEYKAFPQHALEMLTLSVIECSKAGLKASAVDACCTLMKTDMRHEVDAQYKKKFELLIRKRGKGGIDVTDVQEEESPCPRCDASMPNYSHHCNSCNTQIPFCIFSGRHLVAQDFTYCPYCQFPAIYSELVKLSYALLQRGKPLKCPICRTKKVARESYRRHGFVDAYLGSKWINQGSELAHTFLIDDEESYFGYEFESEQFATINGGGGSDTEFSDLEERKGNLDTIPRRFDVVRNINTQYERMMEEM